MKIQKLILLLVMAAPLMQGCDNASPLENYADKIRQTLANSNVRDIKNYSALGYVEKKEDKSGAKGRKNKISHQANSSNPYYLAGLVDGTVKGLDFSSGESSWNIPIEVYVDLGGFIGFSPEGYGAETHVLNGYVGYGINTGSYDFQIQYLLSKKTGKIYSNDNIARGGIDLKDFISGSEVLYAKIIDGSGSDSENWATIIEENNQLVITKNNMLKLISDQIPESKGDKFGNILVGNRVYAYNQTVITFDVDPEAALDYDPYMGIIFTYANDSFYVLNGLEFEKYDNIIFGYDFPEYDTNRSRYGYCIDEDGKYFIAHDEEGLNSFEPEQLYKKTIDEREDSKYNEETGSYESFLCSYERYEMIEGFCARPFLSKEYELTASDDYVITQGNGAGHVYFPFFNMYRKLDTYTYANLTVNLPAQLRDGVEYYAFRNKYCYYVDSSYNLMKYDFKSAVFPNETISEETGKSQIDTQGYQIKTIKEDWAGNLVVEGYDSTFNEFTGYLDENDKITFVPANDNQGYSTVYMDAIN